MLHQCAAWRRPRVGERRTLTVPERSDAEALVPEPGVRVRTHPGLCAGWGNCHRFAPAVYPLDSDGTVAVHLLTVPAEQALDAWIGASVCPARAITVIGLGEAHWRNRMARQGQLDH